MAAYSIMPLPEILELQSCDWGGTVAESLDYVELYKDLYRSMKKDGQLVPICISPRYSLLQNGHHRVKIACMLEWKEMFYTEDFSESDEDYNGEYGKEREQENG
jgi:hypothetical protein